MSLRETGARAKPRSESDRTEFESPGKIESKSGSRWGAGLMQVIRDTKAGEWNQSPELSTAKAASSVRAMNQGLAALASMQRNSTMQSFSASARRATGL